MLSLRRTVDGSPRYFGSVLSVKGKSEIVLTDAGDEAWEHAQGWRPAIELLAKHLRA